MDEGKLKVDKRSLSEMRIRGLEVQYGVFCPRKLWWFSHGLEQENVDGGGTAGHVNVLLGSLIHEQSYPARYQRDILIDDLLRLDFTEGGMVHEVKKSRGGQRASLFQLLYYLYYLRHEKGYITKGVLEFPKLKQRQEVELTPDLEEEVAAVLIEVDRVRSLETPPEVAEPMKVCAKCAYQELCWG